MMTPEQRQHFLRDAAEARPPFTQKLGRDDVLVAMLQSTVELADRLAELEARVDGALNAAYVNYDPLVNQLSELRRELAKVRSTLLYGGPPRPVFEHRETYTLKTEWRDPPDMGLNVTVSNAKYGSLTATMEFSDFAGIDKVDRTTLKEFADALFDRLVGGEGSL